MESKKALPESFVGAKVNFETEENKNVVMVIVKITPDGVIVRAEKPGPYDQDFEVQLDKIQLITRDPEVVRAGVWYDTKYPDDREPLCVDEKDHQWVLQPNNPKWDKEEIQIETHICSKCHVWKDISNYNFTTEKPSPAVRFDWWGV